MKKNSQNEEKNTKSQKIIIKSPPNDQEWSFIELADDGADNTQEFLSDEDFIKILTSKQWKMLVQQNSYLIKSTLIKHPLPNHL